MLLLLNISQLHVNQTIFSRLNCMTILILVHPPLRVQYIDSKTVLQIFKYGLMKIR